MQPEKKSHTLSVLKILTVQIAATHPPSDECITLAMLTGMSSVGVSIQGGLGLTQANYSDVKHEQILRG